MKKCLLAKKLYKTGGSKMYLANIWIYYFQT